MSDLTGRLLKKRYRVLSLIGRGGMAEVYKVWDEQRAVYLALKLLREDLSEDRVWLRRFKREAQTLSRLQHPHIVRYYGLEQEDVLAFILMDFINGSSLRREIFQTRKAFTYQRIVEITRPVCAVLHYAHSLGYIHCDVKPVNMLIDENARVLVTDFGIARMSESPTSTMIGIGTPAYMAPEQIQGEDPIIQTDIYALGIVFFEMLTRGERPFTGDQAKITGTTHEKVRWEQINLSPPSPRLFNPNIDQYTEKVVLRCLEKRPTDRFNSVLEFLRALENAKSKAGIVEEVPPFIKKSRFQNVRSVSPQNHRDQSQIGSRTIRKNWPIPGIALIILILLIGGMFLRGSNSRPSSSQESAVLINTLTSNQIAIREINHPINLIFTSNRQGKTEIYYMNRDGKVS
jgi:serine/threonine protein kinase